MTLQYILLQLDEIFDLGNFFKQIVKDLGINYDNVNKWIHPILENYDEVEQFIRKNAVIPQKKLSIFLSYAKDDEMEVKNIYNFLKHDYDVWMDCYNLLGGQDWTIEIETAIQKADIFISCLSKKSVTKAGYCQKELSDGLKCLELQPDGKIYIIPIKLDNCPIPFKLNKYQFIEWYNKNGKKYLLKTLQNC